MKGAETWKIRRKRTMGQVHVRGSSSFVAKAQYARYASAAPARESASTGIAFGGGPAKLQFSSWSCRCAFRALDLCCMLPVLHSSDFRAGAAELCFAHFRAGAAEAYFVALQTCDCRAGATACYSRATNSRFARWSHGRVDSRSCLN